MISVFGVMFAPHQERLSAGWHDRIGQLPEAFGADFFGVHARHAPPPPGVEAPLRWGAEEGMGQRLGDGAHSIESERRSGFAYYRSVDHFLDLFQNYFGPTIRAMNIVGEDGAEALRGDLASVFHKYDRANDGTVVMETEYLQTVAVRA